MNDRGRFLNLKSKETLLQTYEANAAFLTSRGVKSYESLVEVLGWLLPCIPWPGKNHMGHATQDRLMQLSDGFSVDFDARQLRGYMIRVQNSYDDGPMKSRDGSEGNEFLLLKLRDQRIRYTSVFGIVRSVGTVTPNDIKEFFRFLVRPVEYHPDLSEEMQQKLKREELRVEMCNWSKVSVLPDLYMLTVTVSVPPYVSYHVDAACKQIAEMVLQKIYVSYQIINEAYLVCEYYDETTIRASWNGGGGMYWYVNGCYPLTRSHPIIIHRPSDLASFIISDTQVIANSDLMMIDRAKQAAVLRRIIDCRTEKIDLPFSQCAADKPMTLDQFALDRTRVDHRLATLMYTNTRNETLRQARDDVMQYQPHAELINGPFNVMLTPIVVMNNSPDPDLSQLSFASFCQYHADCGIRRVEVGFDNPRRISDVAVWLADQKKAFDDESTMDIDKADRMITFILPNDANGDIQNQL
jgi:hypothetical protein